MTYGEITRAAFERWRANLMSAPPPPSPLDRFVAAIDPAREGGGSTGITLNIGGQPSTSTPPRPDPRIAAESLLFSILPRDMYIELAAVDECTWRSEASENIYTLSKNNKTVVVKKDGSKWSACIAPEPGEMGEMGEYVSIMERFCGSSPLPPADRVAAEYLLLINDEPRYLATANLTQIGGRREESSGAAIAGAQRRIEDNMRQRAILDLEIGHDSNWAARYPLVGDTVRIQYPRGYGRQQQPDRTIQPSQADHDAMPGLTLDLGGHQLGQGSQRQAQASAELGRSVGASKRTRED